MVRLSSFDNIINSKDGCVGIPRIQLWSILFLLLFSVALRPRRGGLRSQVVECPPYVEPLPSHLLAFRTLVAPEPSERPAVVKSTWRALLPGLAQMWYRLVVLWRETWPYKLLLLIDGDTDEDAKTSIALDLLTSLPCCFGQGGSLALDLHELALELNNTESDQVAFILGPWCRKIITAWSRTISVTIHDVECGNAMVKNCMPTGRPHTLASLAAKGLIHDSISEFYAVHSKWPRDKFKESAAELLQELRAGTQTGTAKRKRKRETCAYDVFRKEQTVQAKSLGVNTPLLSKPEAVLKTCEAYASLSLEEIKGYEIDGYRAKIPARQMCATDQQQLALPMSRPDLRSYEMESLHGHFLWACMEAQSRKIIEC